MLWACSLLLWLHCNSWLKEHSWVVLTWDEGELRLGIWSLSFRLSEFVQDVTVCFWVINLLWMVVWKLLRFLLFFTCAQENLHKENSKGNLQFHNSSQWVFYCDKSSPLCSTRHFFSDSSNWRSVWPGGWLFVSQQDLGNIAEINLLLHWALWLPTVRHCPLSQKWDSIPHIFKRLTPTEAFIWMSLFRRAAELRESEGVKWGDKGCTDCQRQRKEETPFLSGCWKGCQSDPHFVARETPAFILNI